MSTAASNGFVVGAHVGPPGGDHDRAVLVILAFLVGRVRAGADPGLARKTTRPATPQQVAPPSAGSGSDPSDPFAQPQTDPGASGGTDDFGDAVPDRGGGQADPGFGGQSGQGFDPSSTHVS